MLVYFLLTATVWTRQLYPGRDVVTAPGVTGQFDVREYLSFTWQLIFPRPPWLNDLIPGLPIRDTFLHGFIGRLGWVDYGFSPSHQRLASWILVAVGILALVGLITHWRAVRVRWAELATYAVAAAGLVAVIGAAAYRARLSGGTGFEQARYLLLLLPLYGAVVVTAAGAARRFAPVLGAALVLLALAYDVFSELLTVARRTTARRGRPLLMGARDPLEELGDSRRGDVPSGLRRGLVARRGEPGAQRRIAEQPRDARGAHGPRSALGHQAVDAVAAEVAVAVRVGADDGRAGGHRLQDRQAEALVARGLHEHGRLR